MSDFERELQIEMNARRAMTQRGPSRFVKLAAGTKLIEEGTKLVGEGAEALEDAFKAFKGGPKNLDLKSRVPNMQEVNPQDAEGGVLYNYMKSRREERNPYIDIDQNITNLHNGTPAWQAASKDIGVGPSPRQYDEITPKDVAWGGAGMAGIGGLIGYDVGRAKGQQQGQRGQRAQQRRQMSPEEAMAQWSTGNLTAGRRSRFVKIALKEE